MRSRKGLRSARKNVGNSITRKWHRIKTRLAVKLLNAKLKRIISKMNERKSKLTREQEIGEKMEYIRLEIIAQKQLVLIMHMLSREKQTPTVVHEYAQARKDFYESRRELKKLYREYEDSAKLFFNHLGDKK